MSGSAADDDSPTLWLQQLRTGQPEAAQKLWEEYFQRLVLLARQRVQGRVRRTSDEEDIALSAFNSFCRGLDNGRYPQINDRDDLWRLLVTITLRKVLHLHRDQGRQKRGGQWRQVEAGGSSSGDGQAIERIVGNEPSPEFVAELIEEWEHLQSRLGDPSLVNIAVWRMEGHTNREIAGRLNVAERTIERKLQLIRAIWSEEQGEDLS